MHIKIHDDCNSQFKSLKFQKKYRSAVFKIEKEVVMVDHCGKREQTWVEFLHSLPKDECRFAAYDLEFKTNDGINSSKLFFLSWLPDNAKIKMKTLYAAAKESVKQYLELNAKEITCTAIDDYTEEGLIKQFNK